jgi:CubicO group peptidase (beta-lactamase class C family)
MVMVPKNNSADDYSCFRPLRRAFAIVLAWTALSMLTACQSTGSHSVARITPEEAGYSPDKLAKLGPLLKSVGSDSLLLLHDGKILYEWGDTRKKLMVHSIRKPLLNALLGICHGEGRIRLEATLGEMAIEDVVPLTSVEKEATLLHVLQSRSGVYLPAAAESDGMSAARPARGSHLPGTFHYYNNWDFNVAGHVYEKYCGATIYDAFDHLIAKRIGMSNYRNQIATVKTEGSAIDRSWDGFYSFEPQHSRYPAYHFRLTATDLARFGQLYLQRGQWNGQQLVPASWIDLSTTPVSIVDAKYGLAYGVLWDVLVPNNAAERPSFFHTGLGVHMLGVYPKHKLVFVHRVDTEAGVKFDDGNLYRIIRAVHDARVSRH